MRRKPITLVLIGVALFLLYAGLRALRWWLRGSLRAVLLGPAWQWHPHPLIEAAFAIAIIAMIVSALLHWNRQGDDKRGGEEK
ncbi:MAG: hypothetical protein P4L57_02605 [Rhizomicrobium sp.]|nr:hypothetical protein [Rhizomicrobium sp.]